METSNLQAPAGTQEPPATVLTLGIDRSSLIFSRLSVKHLVRLRATCTAAKNIIDALPIWAEILEDMDKMNRYNVSPFDNKPFAWLPKAERDENYVERWAQLEGWSKIVRKDPRIRKSWASLTSYGKCARLYVFSRKIVESFEVEKHLQTSMYTKYTPRGAKYVIYLPPTDKDVDFPWPGCRIPSLKSVSSAVASILKLIHEIILKCNPGILLYYRENDWIIVKAGRLNSTRITPSDVAANMTGKYIDLVYIGT